jgi:restriction system protein
MKYRGDFLAALEKAGMAKTGRWRADLATAANMGRERAREEIKSRLPDPELRAALELHWADPASGAEAMTGDLEGKIESLRGLLDSGIEGAILLGSHALVKRFSALRMEETVEPFCPPASLAGIRNPPKQDDFTNRVKPPSFFEKLLSRRERYDSELASAKDQFAQADSAFRASEGERVARLAQVRADYEAAREGRLAEIRMRNAEIDNLESDFQDGEPFAVTAYFSELLWRSQYPEGFPQSFRITYAPTPKALVIDYELPTSDIVPRVSEFRWVKTGGVIAEKARRPTEIAEIYRDVILSVALRTIHEVVQTDHFSHVAIVAFNGFVNAVDLSTGHDVRPCLISVSVSKERFVHINLSRIDKKTCLLSLGARISPRPAELTPVTPYNWPILLPARI